MSPPECLCGHEAAKHRHAQFECQARVQDRYGRGDRHCPCGMYRPKSLDVARFPL